ncbi:DUF1259 domain-containing protein [Dankookia sp. P2]|uniref:DUF1259 domain-containing protein n=1 Tax=Dankookia sp. P2 TaxID=3423955 RepID=UPI003D663E66
MRKAAFVLLAALVPLASAMAEPDWKGVEAALGRPAALQPDGVRRFGFPRSDLVVQVDGFAVRPALALGSWLAFVEHGGVTEVMGDLVLTQPEVNPVLRRLHAGGLAATALHNHLLRAAPATMYLHVHGHGEAVALARALRTALEASATPLGPPGPAAAAPDFDLAPLDRIIGTAGKVNGGVWQAVLPRPERILEAGMPTPASLGTGMAINVEPLEAGRVAAAGDLVLLADEVEPVQRALAEHSIEVTALHNHTLREEPRLFYMHFWAVGPVEAVATGLRAALDRTAVKRG